MSPTWAASRFVSEKRRVRAPEGSRVASWLVVKVVMGVGQRARVEGGGGKTLIGVRRVSRSVIVS